MSSRRNLKTILFLILAGVFFWAGCGSQKVSKKKRILFTMWGSAIEQKQMEGWIKRFENKNLDIKVKLLNPGIRYTEKVLTMLAGGTPPDVMMVGTAGFGTTYSYAEKGVLFPLDEFIKKEEDKEWKNSIYDKAWGGLSWKGYVYALPREVNGFLLFYNKDIFDKEGLSYPNETWDWEKLIDIAKRITKEENGRITQYGLWEFPKDIAAISYGSTFFDEKGNFVFGRSGDKGAQKGLSLLLKAYKEKAIPSPVVDETAFGKFWSSIFTGRISMWVTGPWACQELARRGTSFKWDMALIPKGEKRVTSLSSVGYAIHKEARNKEICWRLIKFLTCPEILKDFAYSGRAFPAYKTVSQQSYLQDPMYDDIAHKEIPLESLKYGEDFLKSPYKPEIEDIMQRNIDGIILGKNNIEEGLTKMNKEVNALLKEYRTK